MLKQQAELLPPEKERKEREKGREREKEGGRDKGKEERGGRGKEGENVRLKS
jgi:hypothetical protein